MNWRIADRSGWRKITYSISSISIALSSVMRRSDCLIASIRMEWDRWNRVFFQCTLGPADPSPVVLRLTTRLQLRPDQRHEWRGPGSCSLALAEQTELFLDHRGHGQRGQCLVLPGHDDGLHFGVLPRLPQAWQGRLDRQR